MHPTGFDNLKTIIEGSYYDRDAQGEIYIVNRVDNVDLAHLTREYTLSYTCNEIISNLILQFTSKEWSNEVIHGNEEPTCNLSFTWRLNGASLDENDIEAIHMKLKQLFWNCSINGTSSTPLFEKSDTIEIEISVTILDSIEECDVERVEFLCDQNIIFTKDLEKLFLERGNKIND